LREVEAALTDWPFPPQVVVETTAFCNFKCLHCNHKELERKAGSMDGALFRKIIDEIVDEQPDTEIWPTFYGEAFVLGERLFELLRYARDRGARHLVLNSNGSLLHRKDWTDQILQSGLKRFILSLDGFSKETFESIRRGGDRDQVYASVERLLARRDELGLEYPVIQCQFSEMEENRHELEAFKTYWQARGAEVKSRRMLSWSNSGTVVAEDLDYASEFRIACPWGNNSMAIQWNGDVVACACDYEGRFVAGSVRDTSIREIWQGRLQSELREPHRQHRWDDIPEICRSCPDWQAVGATYHQNPGTSEVKSYTRPFWNADD
jgi:radical SAM protein with 4Fe4S-binding SPASM domain